MKFHLVAFVELLNISYFINQIMEFAQILEMFEPSLGPSGLQIPRLKPMFYALIIWT